MTPVCSKCKGPIPDGDINVGTDVAFCRACNLAHKLSSMVHGIELDAAIDLQKPPPGAWCRTSGMGSIVGATHRAVGAALGLLAIALFWNGILCVFLALVISATLQHLGIPSPQWFPDPKMNGAPMNIGMTVFLWIFLTPFILIGLALLAAFVSCLGGKTEVLVHGSNAVIFTGIGKIGRRRRFDRSTAKEVRLEQQKWRDSDGDRQSRKQIVIEFHDGKAIKFGSSLHDDRMKFVAAAARKILLGKL